MRGGGLSGEAAQEAHDQLSEPVAIYKDCNRNESTQLHEELRDIRHDSAVQFEFENGVSPTYPAPPRETQGANISALENISFTILEQLDIVPRF